MLAATCSQYAPPPSTAGPTPANPANPRARKMAFCGTSQPLTGFHRSFSASGTRPWGSNTYTGPWIARTRAVSMYVSCRVAVTTAGPL